VNIDRLVNGYGAEGTWSSRKMWT